MMVPVGVIGSFTLTGEVNRVIAHVADGTLSTMLITKFRQEFAPAGGSPVLAGDRFRIVGLSPTQEVAGLRSLITRVGGVESFTIRNASNAQSQRPQLMAPRFRFNGQLELMFPTETDVVYEIERSRTLLPGSWTLIGTMMGTDGTNSTSLLDPDPGSFFSGFYRIRVR